MTGAAAGSATRTPPGGGPADTALVCTSHSPILHVRPRAPPYEEDLLRVLAQRRDAVRAFGPETVFVFGCDHYAGFHLNAMPAFCVGTGTATAIADVGGFPGELDVDRAAAAGLAGHLRRHGFDVALSERMTVDHGFSQTMKNVLGELDAFPCVPVFIGGMCRPFLQFERTRRFGEAVGGYAATLGRRVLFVASGGLSHHPTRYYPLPGEAEPDVWAWQLAGPLGGTFTEEEWLDRLHDMHVEGGKMLLDGRRTREQIRLNPAVDREFLDIVTSGDVAALDGWQMESLSERAGIGFTELHGWVAATAAHLRCGGAPPEVDFYVDSLEYAIGFGVIHADQTQGAGHGRAA